MLGVFSEQDENSGHAGAGVGRVRSKADTHRPRGPARTPFGSSSGRKALGNITNTKQNSQRQSNLPQQKKAAVSFQLPASEPLPPLKPLAVQDSKPLQGQLDAGNQPAPPLLNQLDFRAQQLAEEGIEIRAGKGWYEQEAARELRIQQEIEARGAFNQKLQRRHASAIARPPEMPDSPRTCSSEAGPEIDAFDPETLPEIDQPAWSIELKAGLNDLHLSLTDSDDECGSDVEVLNSP